MIHHSRLALLAAALSLTTCLAPGNVTLPAIFSDHMVLQKSAKTHIWGKADAGEKIKVTLGAITGQAETGTDGHWQVILDLTPSPAGPLSLEIAGNNTVSVADVLVGEVWVCSGQSNMEFSLGSDLSAHEELNKPANPQLRQFRVPYRASAQPEDDCPGSWVIAGPATRNQFTAVGYYFGKEIQEATSAPVGLISTYWGGTPIESWMSPDAFAKDPDLTPGRDKRLKAITDYAQAKDAYVAAYHPWEEKFARQDKPSASTPWADPATPVTDWKTVALPGRIATAGLPDSGAVWLRKTIAIPATGAGRAGKVDLGTPYDFEAVYWNGRKIGEMTPDTFPGVGAHHVYPIPADQMKAGDNLLAVRLFTPTNHAGILDKLVFALSSGPIPLAGDWLGKSEFELPALSAEAAKAVPLPPQAPGEVQYNPSALYNAMIHPVLPYTIKGATWYQGEANCGRAAEYAKELPLMITDWREKWAIDFPFYICQLANYQAKVATPQDSVWAELREAQSQALATPGTGVAVLIDLGEANNIHYRDKKTAGSRLGQIALAQTYGKPVPFSGPAYDSMKIEGDKVRLTFTHTDGGLVAKPLGETYLLSTLIPATAPLVRNSPNTPLEGFAICGDDHKWVWADQAVIDGTSVLVSSTAVPHPIAVRYAWADNPTCNLYNGAGLPASPFRTDDFKRITEGHAY